MSVLLEVEHLSMSFGGLLAVRDVSFRVSMGEIVAIIGPNGAGKTTVFNCLTGFYRAPVGRMQLTHGGKAFLLERMDAFKISREAKVVRTFQNVRLFAGMSVLENLVVAQHEDTNAAEIVLGLFGRATAMRGQIEKARYWLDKMGLTAAADDRAGTLAYGAQRKLEIARAMCASPVLLCLDEPAAGLNARESEALNALLFDIRREHGIAILIIEHDMGVVMRISDHIVVLDHGASIARGTPSEVRANPAVIRAYLGAPEAADKSAGSLAC
ncbi:MAG TPA: ATP-binding cassette domain-containing protein [Micropepsaceae bacterium]|nr:ATP-binding cassette domain-containing protein [Micropepsaceae bacterium]